MSNSEKFPIEVKLENLADFSKITILDADDQVSVTGYGNMNTELVKGIYTVRVERNGQMVEKIIRHTGKSELNMEGPKGFSSALISGYETSHEYYTYPAESWSKTLTKKTDSGKPENNPGQLFIFIRYSSKEAFSGAIDKPHLFSNFILMDEKGKTVSNFAAEDIMEDFDTGWAAFSAFLGAGFYYLVWRMENQSRVVPITVYKNWQLQIFITHNTRPMFEGLRMFMARPNVGFNAQNPEALFVDEALKRLQNEEYYLPENLLNSLVFGKFENPLLGILASYIYLKGNQTNKNSLFQSVIHNLENHILETKLSPDVQALKILAARHDGIEIPSDEITGIPMLRIGMNSIIAESFSSPDLIPEDSILDQISPRLYHDSPWTSWEYIEPEKATHEVPITESEESDESSPKSAFSTRAIQRTNFKNAFPSSIKKGGSGNDWVINSLINILTAKINRKESVTLISIAEDLGLPPNTVVRRVNGAVNSIGLNQVIVESLKAILKTSLEAKLNAAKLLAILKILKGE